MQFIRSLTILLIILAFITPARAIDTPQTPIRVGIATVPSSPYSIIIEKMGTGDGTIKQDVDTATKDYNPLLILTAIADTKSRFLRWEGNVHSTECYSSSTVIRVTLNAIKTCTAIFELIPDLFTITGKVQDNQSIGVADVAITTQTGRTAITDTAGNFVLTDLISGDYLLTASKYSFSFTPTTTVVTINNSPATASTILATEIFIDDLPRFTSQVVTKAILGETYRYDMVARDPDASETLTISALEKPSWLNLTTTGNGTATLTGNPPNTPTHYFVNLQVMNSKGKKTTQSYALLATPRSNTPPLFTSTPVTQVIENHLYHYNLTVIDKESLPLTLSAISLPNWLNFNENTDGTATLTGTPQHSDIGIHLVSVQSQDAAGEYAIHTFNIAVAAQTYSLTINKIGNGTVTSTPEGIACGTQCQLDYPSGSILNLTALPDPGFIFSGLSGDCNQASLIMNKSLNCIATFTKIDSTPNNPTPNNPIPSNPTDNATCENLKLINISCNMQGKNLADVTIQSSGMISNGIFSGTVDNQGWVANSTLLHTAKLNGGVVTGYMTNLGMMSNFEFRGEELHGGTLSGLIQVTREGVLRDTMLAANTYITGGKLTGEIVGAADAPAMVENVVVTTGSHLTNVILGKNVTLEANVTVEKSASLPQLTDNFGVEWAIAIDNQGLRSRPPARFSGGIATIDNNYFKINTVSLNQAFQVRASIEVAAEDVGKVADILLVMGFEPPDIYGVFDGGVDTIYTSLDNQNRGLPIDLYASATVWMTQFAKPFQSNVLLQPRLFFTLWQGHLSRTGQYYIFLGYRLANGTIIYTPSPLIVQVN